ncbi:hypothetical protein JXE04_00950, partial [Patescibacteria group bacterium]|nr:hypothetical protein [Patescibacteria group bacterium]
TGKELDEDTNLYYYGSRYFNPKTACWLSTDPAMESYIPYAFTSEQAERNDSLPNGGLYNFHNLSPYNFNNNNPIKYIDPDGRMPQAVAAVAGGGGAAIAAWVAAGVVFSILTCITVSKIVDYAKENIRENGPYELHHAFPMFLGGEYKQDLVPIEKGRHKQLHRDLYVFLDKYNHGMKPGPGNSGRVIQSYFSLAETKEAMARFYLVNMDQYADAAARFFSDNPDQLSEENIKWAKEHAFDSRFWQIVQSWLSEETPE